MIKIRVKRVTSDELAIVYRVFHRVGPCLYRYVWEHRRVVSLRTAGCAVWGLLAVAVALQDKLQQQQAKAQEQLLWLRRSTVGPDAGQDTSKELSGSDSGSLMRSANITASILPPGSLN